MFSVLCAMCDTRSKDRSRDKTARIKDVTLYDLDMAEKWREMFFWGAQGLQANGLTDRRSNTLREI